MTSAITSRGVPTTPEDASMLETGLRARRRSMGKLLFIQHLRGS